MSGESRAPLAAFLAASALVVAVSAPTLADLWARWSDPLGYESHGPLVPLVSAWLLWRHRAELAAVPRRPSWAATPLAAGALWLMTAATIESVVAGAALGVLGLLVALALAFFGWPFLRRAWFSFAFLLFAVPAPMSLQLAASARLQALAAALSASALRFAGVPAVRDGTSILLERGVVTVGDACSGLRGLGALVAMAALIASFRQRRLGSLAVLAVAAPIGILANTARILVLCAIAISGHGIEEGLLHEGTGVIVYLVAFLLLLGVHALFRVDEDDAAPADARPPSHEAPGRGALVLLLVVLAGGVAGVLHARSHRDGQHPVTYVARCVPATIGSWTSVEVPLRDDTLRLLGTEDVVIRRFSRAASDATVEVYVNHATGGADRIWHPPEWCYAANGFEPTEDGFATVVAPGLEIPARRFVFRRDVDAVLVYYWYRINGRDVAGYRDFGSTSLLRRVAGLGASEATLVRLATSLEGGPAAAEARIRRFADEALGTVLASVRAP